MLTLHTLKLMLKPMPKPLAEKMGAVRADPSAYPRACQLRTRVNLRVDVHVQEAKVVEKRDMFGRVVAKSQAARGTKRPAATLEREATANSLPVRFKYHEGVTNAVKTELTVHELLS